MIIETYRYKGISKGKIFIFRKNMKNNKRLQIYVIFTILLFENLVLVYCCNSEGGHFGVSENGFQNSGRVR